MVRVLVYVLQLALTAALILGAVGILCAAEKDEDMAVALVEYMVAGRLVVSRNQALINDPSKGFKGFTPDEYERQVREEFLKRTEIDIRTVQPNTYFMTSLHQAHLAARQVIAEAQDQINVPDVGFKKFNPAVFAARLTKKFEKSVGISLKLTSQRNRNPDNRPDPFEKAALERFEADKKDTGHYDEVKEGDREYARYMVPVFLAKSCLSCHGDPVGEKDIAGYPKEGYREGDLRGAISIKFPVAQ